MLLSIKKQINLINEQLYTVLFSINSGLFKAYNKADLGWNSQC